VRRTILVVVGLVASAFFTYIAVRNVDLDLFLDSLQDCNYLWLVPSLLLIAVAVVIRAWRWQFLFDISTRPPLPALTRALLVGQLFNAILPARGGEIARVVVLHQETGTSRVEALATAIVERLYDVLALLLLLFLATPFLPDVDWLRRAALFGLVLIIVVAVAMFAVDRWGVRPVRFVFSPLERLPGVTPAHVERGAANLVQGLGALHRPHLAIPSFALTLASWLVLAGAYWCVIAAFGVGLGLGAGLLLLVATTLALVIPSAPGGLGVFEAAGVVALGAYGIDDSTALSITVVLHALNVFPYILAGWIVLHAHARRLRRLRAAEVA
jgi:glycosyltransferase 2 family protein